MNTHESDVRLRPLCIEDAHVLMELNNNEEISKFVVGTPRKVTFEQQLLWMTRVADEKNTMRWMIDYNGVAVGTIILSGIDGFNRLGNMNIKILPSYQGRGIAKKALLIACNKAFDEMDLFCLTANILPYNAASCALFEKLGFHKDGVLRSRVVKNGQRYDLISFSLLKTERIN